MLREVRQEINKLLPGRYNFPTANLANVIFTASRSPMKYGEHQNTQFIHALRTNPDWHESARELLLAGGPQGEVRLTLRNPQMAVAMYLLCKTVLTPEEQKIPVWSYSYICCDLGLAGNILDTKGYGPITGGLVELVNLIKDENLTWEHIPVGTDFPDCVGAAGEYAAGRLMFCEASLAEEPPFGREGFALFAEVHKGQPCMHMDKRADFLTYDILRFAPDTVGLTPSLAEVAAELLHAGACTTLNEVLEALL